MKISTIFTVAILALAWMLLMESFSPVIIISGIAVGAGCVFFSSRFLPLGKMAGVNFGKIATYPFFLIGQIFFSAAYVSKIIFKGAKIDIVEVHTNIKNDYVRVMLADSVTLTPGSVMLELEGEKMTILWLRERGSPDIETLDEREIADKIMGKLESKLIKAQETR